jgi:RHS repeat-associated protein
MDGRAVAVIEGGEVFFVRTDHIGRPVFATDSDGLKVWEASYLPFGGVHVSTGAINLRFPGQWFQSESGLHQNWMRDYDPTTGRYLQADPLGLVDGASVYGYALQNPGRWVDPRGEFGLPGAIAGAIIGGAVGYYKTGCWQGVLGGAAIGAVAGGLGGPLATALGGNAVVAGAITGYGATAAAQVAVNEISRLCGCTGDPLPISELVRSPDFHLSNLLGSFGGSMGGLVGSSSSVVGGWAAGSFGKEIVAKLVGGGVSTGIKLGPTEGVGSQ